jgi:hypothetical protein
LKINPPCSPREIAFLGRVRDLSPEDRFLYWVIERDRIRVRRGDGHPSPWTDDPILHRARFTDVRREDDRTTAWFRDNVRGPLDGSHGLWFATLCFRWFNWVPTGELLLEEGLLESWDTRRAVRLLSGRGKVFTGAFNISNGGSTKPKVNRVCEDYIEPAWGRRVDLWPRGTLGETHEALSALPGMGGSGFMSAQVVADLKYTVALAGCADWWSWCSPGPGSRKGLAVVRPSSGFRPGVDELRALVRERTGMRLHAQDVQNCLCEFYKYERILNGGGRPKIYYDHQGHGRGAGVAR